MKKIINFFLKRKILSIVILIVLVAGVYFYLASGKKAAATYFVVKRGSVISEVSVTGTVKPAQSLDLAFNASGRIKRIYVNVGAKVSEGQTLSALDNADIAAQLLQAQANVDTEQATLDQLKVGTKPEDLQVERSKLAKVQQDLANDYASVSNILNDAYTKANDAVRQQVDIMFTNSEQANPQVVFQVNGFQIQNDTQSQRYAAGIELNNWQTELAGLGLTTATGTLEQALINGGTHLNIIRNFLYKLSSAVQNSSNLSQSTVSTYKADITTALGEVNTGLTNISNQTQVISSQKVTVAQTQNELDSELAGNLPEQIAAQQAKVEQAKANVAYYQSQLNKTILSAPFSGTVTRVVPDPGDIVNANDPVVSLIGGGAFEIDANIAESDIAKLKVGDEASVTMDAYGPDIIFTAKVVRIDLSSTIIDGVATYKTTLRFDKEDSRILAGLTANLNILSDKKDNVLYIPSRDIISEDDQKFVNVLVDPAKNTIQKIQITTGLRGSEGMTEVISGLNEGEKVEE